jgi:hypothetical protein
MDNIENDFVKFWIEGDILNCAYKSTDIDLNGARIITQDRLKISNGTTYPCLTDITEVKKVTKEARDYLASDPKHLSAAAFIVNSSLNKIIGNFFINISKPEIPTRLFMNKKDALQWLEQFKAKK